MSAGEFRFRLEPVDETYFETAPFRWRHVMDLPVGADEVWRQLTLRRPLTWNRALSDIVFDGDPPYRLGARRNIQALHVLRLREYFFRWDDGRRMYSFYGTSASLPVLQSFAEDYVVDETASGCTFTWTFAATPKRGLGTVMRAGRPLNDAFFNSFANDTRKHFGAA